MNPRGITTACTRPPTRCFSCFFKGTGRRVMPGVRLLRDYERPEVSDRLRSLLARRSRYLFVFALPHLWTNRWGCRPHSCSVLVLRCGTLRLPSHLPAHHALAAASVAWLPAGRRLPGGRCVDVRRPDSPYSWHVL